jgi:putative MATE family efflux protein
VGRDELAAASDDMTREGVALPISVDGEGGVTVGASAAPLRASMSERQLRRRVWSLALPAIGEQVLALGVGVSDTFLAGHLTPEASAHLGYGQATAVAAVGVATMATWVTITVFLAVNVGVTALVARATGAGNRALASRAAAQGVVLGFLIGLAMIGLAVPLADVIIAGLGVNGEVALLAAQFVRIISLGLPFTGAASAATAAMRGAGDARRPLMVMLVVNGINVIASWTLLNGRPELGIPAIGVVGSACGAATGWTFGALLALTLLLRTHPRAPRIALPLLRPERKVIQRILNVGLPSAVEIAVFQVGILTFGRVVVGLGSTSYAAYTTINTVESLGTLPGFGFAVAATALVGQALGARAPRLAARTVFASLRPCFMVMATIGLLEALVPHMLLGLFVADPAVIRAGELAMRISLFTQTASALAFVFNGALRGAGDTKFPVVVRAAGTWGLRVPIAAVLIPLWALPGARFAMALDFWAQAGLAYWRFRSGKWRHMKL